jgi:glycosyltransferase involved in cell wall biosynthesis
MSSSPARIALALESSGPGGAEQMVLRLASALSKQGLEPYIVTARPGWMTERAKLDDIPVMVMPQRYGLDPWWIPRFARWLRRERIDILHSHEFAMNVYGGAAALLARVAHVATIHGRHWVADHPRRALAYRVLQKLGMPIVAVADDLADYLSTGLGVRRNAITVIPNGIPVPDQVQATDAIARVRARQALGLPCDAPVVVAVGNLYRVKDHATLVRAVAQIPDAHVAIAGRGEEEQPLRALARELGSESRLHLLGLRNDVHNVLAAGDLLVQPSRSEGLPLALLEAMAAGKAVIASRVGGMPEVVKDGQTGRLFPAGQADALTRILEELLGDIDARESLGAAGHAAVRDRFSIDKMVNEYIEIYRFRYDHAHASSSNSVCDSQ